MHFSEHQLALFPSNFGTLVLLSQGGGGVQPIFYQSSRQALWNQEGFGLVWVNASPGRPGPRSAQPSLHDSTGLGAPGCHGLKTCWTANSP